MFKWLGKQSEGETRNTKRLWENEFNIVSEGLDEKQVVAFVDNLIAQHKTLQKASADSLRSLLETAIADAEQLAASIKAKSQSEAETKATEIINQAKQKREEIKRSTKVAAEKEAGDILAAANRKAQITEVEAKQQALLFLLRAREETEKEVGEEYKKVYARLSSFLQNLLDEGQNIEGELKDKRAQLWENRKFGLKEHEAALLKAYEEAPHTVETLAGKTEEEQPIQPQEEVVEEKTEKAVQDQEEVSEEEEGQPIQPQVEVVGENIEELTQLEAKAPVYTVMEEAKDKSPGGPPLLGITGEEKAIDIKSKPVDKNTVYAGEIDLEIAVPVELKMVSQFYNSLQRIADLKILRTAGSFDRGTTITVVADKPIPLISKLSEIPGIKVVAEIPEENTSAMKKAARLGRKIDDKIMQRIHLSLTER
ncbi:hypothetical protein ACFLYC_02335 [Chloroflexota bacterium]